MNTLTKSITDQINEMTDSQLVDLNNAYCQSAGYSDNEIYSNDEDFFEICFSNRIIEAVRAVSYGDYSYQHEYVKFNGFGNLESFNNVNTDDLVESIEIIAIYAIENQLDFDMLDFDI